MISAGERSMPPSIGLKMSAVICGKSAVLFPAALASSIGSFFFQLANASKAPAHTPTQSPTRLRRRRWPLASSSAFTESALIRSERNVWQENSNSRYLENTEQTLRDREKAEASPG